jgi:hypothetical protein
MDDQKNQILVAVIAFNLVIMLSMGYMSISRGLDGLSFGHFVIGILLGAVAAGGAFAVAAMKK